MTAAHDPHDCSCCSAFISFAYRLIRKKPPVFEDCCHRHDYHYEKRGMLPISSSAGTYHKISRMEADRLFRRCIKAHGRPVQAWAFWAGVRAGGWLYWWDLVGKKSQGETKDDSTE